MAVTKIYRGTYWVDNAEVVPGADRATESEAIDDIEAGETTAAAAGYDSFMGIVEVFYVGDDGVSI